MFLEVQTAIDTGEVLVTPGRRRARRPAVRSRPPTSSSAPPGPARSFSASRPCPRPRRSSRSRPSRRASHRLVGLLPDVHGRALRLDSPLVGRRRQLAALSSAFESVVTERALHLLHRPRRRRRREVAARAGVRRERGKCRDPAPRAVPPLRRGDHVPAARRIPRRRERPGDRGDGAATHAKHWRSLRPSARSFSSWMTCSGPSRRCSTSSRTSPRRRRTRRSCSSASRAPSCWRREAAGARGPSRRARSSSTR